MPVSVTRRDLVNGSAPAGPRLRVDRSAPLTLSADWQRVAFTGTSQGNLNTFPAVAEGQLVEWDANASLFRFHAAADRDYTMTIFFRCTGAAAAGTVQARMVVPTAIAFPFPETVQRLDLKELAVGQEWADYREISLTADSPLQSLGLGVELRSTSGSPVLNECIVVLYGE